MKVQGAMLRQEVGPELGQIPSQVSGSYVVADLSLTISAPITTPTFAWDKNAVTAFSLGGR
jgi:adenylyl- and sulfurtransferase ThiI